MPWEEVTIMAQRKEFVLQASQTLRPFNQICETYRISRKTGYKWLRRFRELGEDGLTDRSHRTLRPPLRTPPETEALIRKVRGEHPAWGPRKIRTRLQTLGYRGLPAPSTITEILRRSGMIAEEESEKRKPFRHFVYPEPNDLWQMDFKGDVPVGDRICTPLTMLDDHSRFSLLLEACRDRTRGTVEDYLRGSFERFGLPRRMLFDNGAPWAPATRGEMTALKLWLLRLGIIVIFSTPKHPQTLGKEERFHRTMKAECLRGRRFETLSQLQERLDEWQPVYNFERPHEALEMKTPGEVYRVSPRTYPDRLPPIEYDSRDMVRTVWNARIHLHGRLWRVGRAFEGHPVGVRPTMVDGVFEVYFGQILVKRLDARENRGVVTGE